MVNNHLNSLFLLKNSAVADFLRFTPQRIDRYASSQEQRNSTNITSILLTESESK